VQASTGPQFAAVASVASRLDVCPNTVHNLVKRGHIKSIKVGRRRLIDLASLDAYLASQEVQS
jgi:excisionase family DNA binding protein